MKTDLCAADEKTDGIIEGGVKDKPKMNEAQKRANRGRSDVCTV